MVTLLLACAGDPADPTRPGVEDSGTTAPAPAEMDAERLLVRISLDLRGVRPDPAELDAAGLRGPGAANERVAVFVRV